MACRCGPVSVSTVPALSATVCPSGMGTAVAASVDRQTFLADPPHVIGHFGGGCAQPSQIVESDRRVGPDQVDVGVEVAQQPVGQAVGQGAELFFSVFDHRPERGVAGHHLRPAQPTDGQRHRVFGGEPAHGARQVHIGGQVLVAPVALDVDADRRAAVARGIRPTPTRTRSTGCRASRRETPRAPHPKAGGSSQHHPATPTSTRR